MFRVFSRFYILCLLLICMIFTHQPCIAAEGGIGAYWPGFRSFMTGVVPSKEGLYLRNDVVVYSASAPRVVLNGLPIENISVDAVFDIIEPTYVFPKKLFGANRAAVITQSLIWLKQSGGIIGTDIEPSDSRFAPGDTVISPIYLGWQKNKLFYSATIAVFIPTATYDINRVVNTSRNYWTVDPEFGITYFNPNTGWDISGAIGYSINTKNPATDYKSGDVLHFDYAVGKTLKSGIKPGVVGYAWVQTTADSGSGALFGPFRSRVFGIGPGVVWRKGTSSEMRFRYYHEFGASNHLEGDQFVFTYRVAF